MEKVASSISSDVIGFFNSLNPFNHTVAMSSTQPLTKIHTRNLPGSKGQPVGNGVNVTNICELTVQKMWEP
jgi:hypothetical protein